MKIGELTRCLKGKLKLQERQAPRHTDYRVVCGEEIIPLPTLLRVSRGSGEVTGNNLGGMAKALGLNEHAMREMVGCHINRACVLVCLAAYLLQFIQQKRKDEGEVFRAGLNAMLESIELLLQETELQCVPCWTKMEQKALDRAGQVIDEFIGDEECGKLAAQLKDLMAAP